jgi:hypothetical protein
MQPLDFLKPSGRFALMAAFVLASALSFAASSTTTGSMRSPRDSHTAILLPNGNVLAAGGSNNNVALASSEIDNAATGWKSTGSMRVGRMSTTATLVSSGKMLIAGGQANDALGSAELYNPSTGTFALTGKRITPRSGHTATLLAQWSGRDGWRRERQRPQYLES